MDTNFNEYFLKLYFQVFGFGLVMLFFWPQSWHAYSKCEPKSEWYVIFKMSRLELCLSLLKMPIALFNFILTLDKDMQKGCVQGVELVLDAHNVY